jgi:hypothetical protein
MTLRTLLSAPSPGELRDLGGEWDQRVFAEITGPAARAAVPPGQHLLDRDASWVLLGWVERMATLAVRRNSADLLAAAVSGLTLADRSAIDERDVLVVSAVCGRAGELLGLDWEQLRLLADPLVDSAGRSWLAAIAGSATSGLPSTYVESGSGVTFAFEREPADHGLEAELDDLLDSPPAAPHPPNDTPHERSA